MTSPVRSVDLRDIPLGPTGRWAAFLTGVFDLDHDICERADRILRPMEPRTVVHALAGELDDPEGVLLASVDDRDSTVGHIELLGVRGDHRGRGLARDLVTFAEGALAARGIDTMLWSGNAPCYAWPGVDLRYTAGLGAAESFGYVETRLAHDMTVDLADAARRGVFAGCRAMTGMPGRAVDDSVAPRVGADQRLSEAGIVVLRLGDLTEGPDDGLERVERRLLDWVASEFGVAWRVEVAETLRRSRAGQTAGVYIGMRHEQIVGFAAYGAQRQRLFGPMGTALSARGTGIGSRLLRECLAEQFVAGLEHADIGWVGPVGFYSKVVGARVSRVYRLFSKSIGPS
jgi:ribosomal protein S18 acetylase RimI-like enzyme